jgi:hypothetical protein
VSRESTTAQAVRTADVFAYGLVPAGTVLPDGLVGVTRRPVETTTLAGLTAVVSRDVDPAELGLAEDLLAHTRVLDTLALSADVVPLAFGTLLPPPAEAPETFELLRGAYAEASQRVAGAVQWTLTVRYVERTALAELVAEDPRIARLRDATAGTAEHEARSQKLQLGRLVVEGLEAKAARDAEQVLAAVSSMARAVSRRERRQADEMVEVAALVDRDAADRFTEMSEALARGLDQRATVRLLGPQAPYDFVQEADRWAS